MINSAWFGHLRGWTLGLWGLHYHVRHVWQGLLRGLRHAFGQPLWPLWPSLSFITSAGNIFSDFLDLDMVVSKYRNIGRSTLIRTPRTMWPLTPLVLVFEGEQGGPWPKYQLDNTTGFQSRVWKPYIHTEITGHLLFMFHKIWHKSQGMFTHPHTNQWYVGAQDGSKDQMQGLNKGPCIALSWRSCHVGFHN